MSIEVLLDQISSSLTQLSIQSRINNYNMVAGRLGQPQYEVSFSQAVNLEGLDSSASVDELQLAGVMVKEQAQDVDEIVLRAIELSSQNNRMVTLLNSRLELERMMIKGGR